MSCRLLYSVVYQERARGAAVYWGFRISVSRGYQEVLGPPYIPIPIESPRSRELLCCAVNPSNALCAEKTSVEAKFGLAGAMLNIHVSRFIIFEISINYYHQWIKIYDRIFRTFNTYAPYFKQPFLASNALTQKSGHGVTRGIIRAFDWYRGLGGNSGNWERDLS